ncbi:porin family protein [Maribacter sp. PR1]|uniref:Porin family protein n=1 Tax=Maribacter cobaltidurans TaxID=1178778 RepID=A0ABU7IZ25_9FLAO|nr:MULTISPECIES: porin family protein [Maribacter]MDC6390839.1 porin family protein [Maribacter sp. PR1]MEE1978231.1 porin family protein [Maribacter cobaltidurans]
MKYCRIYRRAVFAMALFLFSYIGVQSQETHLGVKGGFNYSSIVGDLTDGLKFRFSGHGGVFLEIDFYGNFKLQPEVLYSSQGFQYSTDLAAIQSNGSVGEENDFRTNVQLNYITVPILGKFVLNERIDIEFGPQFGFLLNQVTKNKNLDQNSNIERRSTVSGDFQLDYGAAVGLGIKLNDYLSLSPRFYIGLRNRLNALQGAQNYNAAIQLSLNYSIN